MGPLTVHIMHAFRREDGMDRNDRRHLQYLRTEGALD